MSVNKRLVIFDFDNTLFDWVNVWHSSFSAMMGEVERLTGYSVYDLAPEIRKVHSFHGTSEYAFLLGALPSLEKFYQNSSPSVFFSDAIDAYRAARKDTLHLYERVADTLLKIKGSGTKIAIYTESQSYYSFYRLKRLGLDGVVDAIYTPHDHEIPLSVASGEERYYHPNFYQPTYTTHRNTPRGELKPNVKILNAIINDFGTKREEVLYVGDSKQKDIAMAVEAQVDHAWAKYGEAQDTEAYNLLKLVTHWSDEDVARENIIRSRPVDIAISLENYISEIFNHFTFSEWHPKR